VRLGFCWVLLVGLLSIGKPAAAQEPELEQLPLPSVGVWLDLAPSATRSGQPQAAPDPHQESSPQLSGSIAGTITDPSGAHVSGAEIRLMRAGQTSLAQAVSDDDGRFVFLNVAPGDFQLTISAEGFRTQEVSGTVYSNEHYLVPQVTLSLAEHLTQITVTPQTQKEVAEGQIKLQETQRVFGIVPNFYVSYVHDAVPLTFKEKIKLAWKTSEDPMTIGSVAFGAGIEQERNWYRAYGKGARGTGNASVQPMVMWQWGHSSEAQSRRRCLSRIRDTSTKAREAGGHGFVMRSAGR